MAIGPLQIKKPLNKTNIQTKKSTSNRFRNFPEHLERKRLTNKTTKQKL